MNPHLEYGQAIPGMQQRGVVKELRVDHYGGSDNGRTHARVPFYVSSAGYGVLVDAARYITVYAGTAVRTDSEDPPEIRDRNTDRRWTSQPRADAVEVITVELAATRPVSCEARLRETRVDGPSATETTFGGG